MKRICLLTAAILTLSACDNAAKHQSTGFSGLGSEPTMAQADYLDPRLNIGKLYSDIPSRAVRSGSANRADHAELVIRKASGSAWRSKRVTVGGQPLALSVLYVNTSPLLCWSRNRGCSRLISCRKPALPWAPMRLS